MVVNETRRLYQHCRFMMDLSELCVLWVTASITVFFGKEQALGALCPSLDDTLILEYHEAFSDGFSDLDTV